MRPGELPDAWRDDPYLLGEHAQADVLGRWTGDDALVAVLEGGGHGCGLYALGAPDGEHGLGRRPRRRLVGRAAGRPAHGGHRRPPVPPGLPAHLVSLGVDPVTRGQGPSGVVLGAAVRDCLQLEPAVGPRMVSLGLYAANDVARRVYLSPGFRPHHRFATRRRPA